MLEGKTLILVIQQIFQGSFPNLIYKRYFYCRWIDILFKKSSIYFGYDLV